LTVDGTYALDKSWGFTKAFSIPYALYNYNPVNNEYTPEITGGSAGKPTLNQSQEDRSLKTLSVKTNYTKYLGGHNIKALSGYEQSKRQNEDFSAGSINFPTSATPELSQGGSAATDKSISGSSSIYTRRSAFGRVSYDYMEKYLFEVQLRADGSSIFPKGKQWGVFPGGSVGWVISKEPWFESSVPFISNLKIRASYGRLGNDNVANFQYFNNLSFYNRYVLNTDRVTGIELAKLANPNITWETADKVDIGINASFLNNISAELVFFQQKRSNILAPRNASIPQLTGIVNPYGGQTLVPYENIGKINNAGVEATLGYEHKGPFSYNASANVTYAKSKVIFVDEAPGVLEHQKETGRPLNSYLLYNAIGIYRTNADFANNISLPGNQLGDLIYEDYDGDKAITADDRVRSKYGNIPELVFGLTLGANWKSFDLSMSFSGQARVSQYVLFESGTIGNFYSSWADNRWSPNNVAVSYPRVDERASSSINGGLYNNSFWLHDAAFFRFKSCEIGYSIPTDPVSRLGVEALRVYFNGFNLFVLSKIKDWDPEGSSSSGQFYPQQRIFNFGVSVKF